MTVITQPALPGFAPLDPDKLRTRLVEALQLIHKVSIAAEKWARADSQAETEIGENVLLEFADNGETTVIALAHDLGIPAAELEVLTSKEYGPRWRYFHLLEVEEECECGEEQCPYCGGCEHADDCPTLTKKAS